MLFRSNQGYKDRVTDDKNVAASADAAGPVTTNVKGFKSQSCQMGMAKDATKGYH